MNTQSNEIYGEENEKLKKMHQQRLARKRLAQKQDKESFNDEKQESYDIDKKRSLNKFPNILKEGGPKKNKIWLNSLIYDRRLLSEKANSLSLISLFQIDPCTFSMGTIKTQVQAIVITTYGFETELFQPIIESGVPMFIYSRRKNSAEGLIERNYEGSKNVTVLSPPKVGSSYGVFHTKLWLIKFKEFLRVVVCTANNHLFDWSIWQNAFWYQDFPKTELRQESKTGYNFSNDFRSTLDQTLTAMQPKGFNLFQQIKMNLADYDFSDVEVVLIPSIQGRYSSEQMGKYGIAKVKAVLSKIGGQFQRPIMTCNSTSLGKINEQFLKDMYSAFCPHSVSFQADKIRLIYPTEEYIKKETCGEASVLCFTKENYQACELKEEIFYAYEPSSRNGARGSIPHLKTIILEEEGDSNRCIFYMGSHNMTRAAWGTYEKGRKQLRCSNWELGLLFVSYSKQELLKWLPYSYPPRKYVKQRPYLMRFG